MPETSPAIVFHANGIGDDLINRPALALLADRFQGRAILVTCQRARSHFLLADLPFQKVVRVEVDGGRFDVDRVLAQVPRKPDVFVSLAPYYSEDLDAVCVNSSPRLSIGFGATFDVQTDMLAPGHAADLAIAVCHQAGVTEGFQPERNPLAFSAGTREKVGKLIEGIRRSRSPGIVCAHSETYVNKRVPSAVFASALCQFLEARSDHTVVMVDAGRFDAVCACHGRRIVSVEGMSLEFAMALIGNADLFFGIDSCMLHAADYQGVPGVTLFGAATSPAKFGYRWSRSAAVRFSATDEPGLASRAASALLSMAEHQRVGR